MGVAVRRPVRRVRQSDRQALLVALLERPEQLVPQVRWVRKVWQEHLEQLVLQGRLAQPERPVQMV